MITTIQDARGHLQLLKNEITDSILKLPTDSKLKLFKNWVTFGKVRWMLDSDLSELEQQNCIDCINKFIEGHENHTIYVMMVNSYTFIMFPEKSEEEVLSKIKKCLLLL